MKSHILACVSIYVLSIAPVLVFGQVPPAPVITGFFPSAQCSNGLVTIVGRNFINVETVRFGRVNAALFAVNRTGDTIRAIVDRNGASGAITVITSLVATSTSANFTFLRPNDITQTLITDVRPFPLSVRETVVEATLVGTFAVSCTNPTGSVSLTKSVGDSTLRMSVVPVIRSETERTFTVPQAFMRSTGNIVCTFADGVSAPVTTTLTVTARQPRITSILPSATNATGQAFQLTILGEDLEDVKSVFMGWAFTTVVSISPKRIVVNIPASFNVEGVWDIELAISRTFIIGSKYLIGKVLPEPKITQIRFRREIAEGEIYLDIFGKNFVTGANISFYAFDREPEIKLSVSAFSEEKITAILGRSSFFIHTFRVFVTNPDGQFDNMFMTFLSNAQELPVSSYLYPNPAHETVAIETNNPTPRTVTLILRNTLGQELMRLTKEMPAGRVTTPLEVGRFPAGTYFLEIQSGSQERGATERVVERLVKY